MVLYEVSKADICYNIDKIKEKAGVPIWGVIKYDGYGVGMVSMAHILKSKGITRFCVAEIDDAILLREEGFEEEEILLLSPPQANTDIYRAIMYKIILPIGSLDYFIKVKNVVRDLDITPEAHISIDTGMGRFGFDPQRNFNDILYLYKNQRDIKISGIYTHFYDAYLKKNHSENQIYIFKSLLNSLKERDVNVGMTHICNSAGLFKYGCADMDAVRIGSALLGRITGYPAERSGLKRVGVLCAEVSSVKFIIKGHNIGYGSRYKTKRDTMVAVVCAGRWHGIKELSLKDRILKRLPTLMINENNVKCIAASSEGNTYVDVSGTNVKEGDIARIDVNTLCVHKDVPRKIV